MNDAAKNENRLALQELLGLAPEHTESTLDASVLVTNAEDKTSRVIARYVYDLLSRTLHEVRDYPSDDARPNLEIVIGGANPITDNAIFVQVQPDAFEIAKTRFPSSKTIHELPEPFALLGACYVAGFALRALVSRETRIPEREKLSIDFTAIFGKDTAYLNREVDVGTTYLAGAGAVGNGFMLGLTTFPNLVGKMIVADHDEVSEGNLNRCLWFEPQDVGEKKSKVLVGKAQDSFDKLILDSRTCMLGEVPEKNDGAWLERLIVAVDSRRARRSLQSELPGEVFDASTTGIEEIVIHHHKQPNDGACLGCIYYADEAEDQHAQHVASILGVSIDDVTKTHIDASAELKIKRKYPELNSRPLVGLAFDTFFKELCGAGELAVDGGERVIAPLAFVSVMAGTYLAIEFVRRMATKENHFNYWRLHPWLEPVLKARHSALPIHTQCEYCNNADFMALAEKLWGRSRVKPTEALGSVR